LQSAFWHSEQSDLFIVAGSSLVVSPANEMPRVALESEARLVIINKGETPLDSHCHLRFEERIGEVLPPAVEKLRRLMQ
jgi:NAD-dependent deacetylase